MSYPLTINNAALSSTNSEVTITIESETKFTVNRLRENKLPEQTHFTFPNEEEMLSKLDSLTRGKEVTDYISMRVSTLSEGIKYVSATVLTLVLSVFLGAFTFGTVLMFVDPTATLHSGWEIFGLVIFCYFELSFLNLLIDDYIYGLTENFASYTIWSGFLIYILSFCMGVIVSGELLLLFIPVLIFGIFGTRINSAKTKRSEVDLRLYRLFFLKDRHDIYTPTLSKAKYVDEILCLAKADKLFFIQTVEQELDYYLSRNNAIVNNVTEALADVEASCSAQEAVPTYAISNEHNLVDLLSSVGLVGTANATIVPMYEMFSEQELNKVFNGQLEQKIEALRDLIQLYANSKGLNSEAIHNQSHELKLLIVDSAQKMFTQAEEEYVNKMAREIEDAKALFNKG